MKKHIFNPFILSLGATIAVAATTSYALNSPTYSMSEISRTDAHNISSNALSSAFSVEEVAIQDPNIEPTSPLPEQFILSEYTIKTGDSLSKIFEKMNLAHSDMKSILYRTQLGNEFINISPGKKLSVKTKVNGELQELLYHKNKIDQLVATRSDDNTFTVEITQKSIQRIAVNEQFTIKNSLFSDGKDAGLTDKTIMQLVNIFAWDIDFSLNIKTGDHISVLYEKLYLDEEQIDTGNILAVEFINQGIPHSAVRFEGPTGQSGYYSPEGKRMQKAFLRSPVDFARISSHFNLKRRHPVLNTIRAHKGIDYAAKSGTPVKSTAKGKVIFRGWKGGYGRVIMVQHAKNYSTVYAHLSKFGKKIKSGDLVEQGQVIGYVGKSGMASGPHLHYELRVNGIHKNPLKVQMPNSEPLNQALMGDFIIQTQPLLKQLSNINTVKLAENLF